MEDGEAVAVAQVEAGSSISLQKAFEALSEHVCICRL